MSLIMKLAEGAQLLVMVALARLMMTRGGMIPFAQFTSSLESLLLLLAELADEHSSSESRAFRPPCTGISSPSHADEG